MSPPPPHLLARSPFCSVVAGLRRPQTAHLHTPSTTVVIMAPLDSSSIQPVENNFELLCSMKCNNLIPVSKYRSPRTGLTVVIASVEGPVVKGYFTVGKCCMNGYVTLIWSLSLYTWRFILQLSAYICGQYHICFE